MPPSKKPTGRHARTCTVRARIDPELKTKAEAIFETVGLSPSEAVRLFYTHVTLADGLPFPVAVPNAETREALRDADAGMGNRYENASDLFEKLGI